MDIDKTMDVQEMICHFMIIRYGDGDIDAALTALVESSNFNSRAIFHSRAWERVCNALGMRKEKYKISLKLWPDLVRPSLFMILRELPKALWDELLEADLSSAVAERGNSRLYSYMRRALANEIEKDLFDGHSTYTYLTQEEEWPADPEEPERPWEDAYYDEGPGVEELVFDKVMLDQIKNMVSETEWEIITAKHGDGPMLADKYNTSESNIRNIRQRTIERLRNKFCDE